MWWVAEYQSALVWGKSLKAELPRAKTLGYLMAVAILVAVIAGFTLFLIDPNVRSPLDGVWAAWVTMTHVGFGDVVPASFLGRLLAALLILFGLAVFSLFTALVSVTLISKNLDVAEAEAQRPECGIAPAGSEGGRILAELERLHERLDQLERRLTIPPKGASPGARPGRSR